MRKYQQSSKVLLGLPCQRDFGTRRKQQQPEFQKVTFVPSPLAPVSRLRQPLKHNRPAPTSLERLSRLHFTADKSDRQVSNNILIHVLLYNSNVLNGPSKLNNKLNKQNITFSHYKI